MNNILSVINEAAKGNNTEAFIQECEREYLDEIQNLALFIKKNTNIKIVMIAGPSASGKTTTAHILKSYLAENGVNSKTVSLDNFYFSRKDLPKLPSGETDTESVNSLDIETLDFCLNEIIEKGKTVMPYFDFVTGESIKNKISVDITDGGILIVEGLHALNPMITDKLNKSSIYKVYISAATPIIDDYGDELLSSKKVRFIRRAIRDARERGADINATMRMWPQVLKGENEFLYPFKDTADRIMKTLHPYELCIYKNQFLAMMEQADTELPTYAYASLTINPLKLFESLPESVVPFDSLIREFIGSGKYNG